MSRSSSIEAAGGRFAFLAAMIVAATLSLPPGALAYEQYSLNRDSTNCRACHGDFRASNYTELAPDGGTWMNGLHDTHRNTMLSGDCSTCHGAGPRFPVRTDSSVGGDGLDPISCVGCHGRLEDASGGTQGAGAGLRQHHWRAGENVCVGCHADADPSSFTTAGEETQPPYYANPGVNHPDAPTDTCDVSAQSFEDYAGNTKGLDNDGDGLYDDADPDCGPAALCGDGNVEGGEECDDGNTSDGDCCSAVCTFESSGASCDDGVGCTDPDVCDGAGVCASTPNDALCDDTQFCNGIELCDPLLDCQTGTPVDCDDGVGCTADSCDEQGDACVNAPDDAVCDDGEFCNGPETCDPAQDCQAGVAVDCDDAEICTDDSCNEGTDSCDNVFDPTNDPQCALPICGNGFVEDGEECDDGNTSDGDCCSAVCTFESSGASCDDGVGCTDPDVCDGAGVCAGTPSDAFCDDAQFCNGIELCDPLLDCQAGTPVDCDDGVGCTADSCDEQGDACVNAPDDVVCDDGEFCNGPETCDAAQGCQAGTPVDCDDGVGCTADSCDEQSDTCVNAPDDAVCDDGEFCNGPETCDPAQDCQAGVAVDCDDADICTDDSCNVGTDSCDNVFDPTNDPQCDARCPDDDADGFSTAGGVCGPLDCDDGDPGVNPGVSELCDDDKDNDCDQLVDAADDECGFTGEWTVRPGPLDDATYAGSTACMECHANHFQSWRDSLHARILIRPGDAQAAGFALPPNDPAAGVEVQSWSDVLFVIGQKWKTQLVDRSGNIQGVQWNYLLGQWVAYNGGQLDGYDCGSCHSTGYDPDAAFLDDQGRPVPAIEGSWVEFNIGCEACHGPGAAHTAAPARDNINQIVFDWYDPDNDGEPDPVDVRSSVLCANCHYRGDRQQIQTDLQHREQYNDWLVSGHASTVRPDPNDPVEFASVSTYCAQCHSPGNAEFFASEHNFNYYEPASATHVACISCHDPHGTSQPRWATLEFPPAGLQDPRLHQAAIARYRGTDDDPLTVDYEVFENQDTDALCSDCHREMPGFRRHKDARAVEQIVLQPPANPFVPGSPGVPFTVPHREHVDQGYADCVDCHMHYSRQSINSKDVRTHSFLPNEWAVDRSLILSALPHFADTCGQCHAQALDCDWCHTGLGVSAGRGSRLDNTTGKTRSGRPQLGTGHR